MHANRRNFRVYEEIGAEEHEGDVRFWTGSRNITVSRMRNKNMQPEQFGHRGLYGHGTDTTFHRTYF